MIVATSLKNGKTFLMDGNPYKVIKYFHQKIARGGGSVRLTVRNLKTGNSEERTLSSTVKVEEITTIKRPLQFLYTGGSVGVFMDSKTFEQIEIPIDIIQDELKFIKEGENVDVLFWDEKALAVDIPPKVNLKVSETDPGIKGNSASNMYKAATLENKMNTRVPLFVKIGDTVRIDTRTGEYVERVVVN